MSQIMVDVNATQTEYYDMLRDPCRGDLRWAPLWHFEDIACQLVRRRMRAEVVRMITNVHERLVEVVAQPPMPLLLACDGVAEAHLEGGGGDEGALPPGVLDRIVLEYQKLKAMPECCRSRAVDAILAWLGTEADLRAEWKEKLRPLVKCANIFVASIWHVERGHSSNKRRATKHFGKAKSFRRQAAEYVVRESMGIYRAYGGRNASKASMSMTQKQFSKQRAAWGARAGVGGNVKQAYVNYNMKLHAQRAGRQVSLTKDARMALEAELRAQFDNLSEEDRRQSVMYCCLFA